MAALIIRMHLSSSGVIPFARWIQNELDDLVTEARCSQYIRQLRDTLWPDGHLDSSQKNVPTAEEREHTKARAVKDLKDFFPGGWRFDNLASSYFSHC